LDQFRTSISGEEFAGFETNVQKANLTAARLYQKIGFELETNPRNGASWTARRQRTLD
jgi:hypothetical protein